ncbi:MAG: ThiF family adenylyltransferase [Chloroflexi bacterium]|nr:ThiF family adenylyltransferase [Chloroflexota bacterium]
MHDATSFGKGMVEHERAILEVTECLREHTGGATTRIEQGAIATAYETRKFADGWRIPVAFSDGKTRNVDLLVSLHFPRSAPRAALVDRPEYLSWPHIEHDGVLCLLPNSSEIDPTAPGEVALAILNRAVRLVEELIEGSIVERDFRQEFLTYWFYACQETGKNVVIVCEPVGPSRVLSRFTWEGKVYVGEDVSSLQQWLDRRFGARTAAKVAKAAKPAAFIWLQEPLLPNEYPESGSDILKLTPERDEGAVGILAEAASAGDDECLVLLGAEGRGGAGVVAVRIDRNRSQRTGNRRARDKMHRGFRAGRLPPAVAMERTYGRNEVRRAEVERADAAWVHGRGQDARSRILSEKFVTVFGCGSVGSFVTQSLAQAGVGTLRLVDFDKLSWANVGRHALGADSVGQNKAEALEERLQREFPHLQFEGHNSTIGATLLTDEAWLTGSDLIVCLTGDWVAESWLNEWHVKSGLDNAVLYGWTEDYAVAGSAVVITPKGRCLACGIGRTGTPILTAVDWPDGVEAYTEPSCADHYQPYGAIELSYITTMIADTAIDELLNASETSYRRIWVSGRQAEYGGTLSKAFTEALGGRDMENGIVTLAWGNEVCAVCKQHPTETTHE